MNKLLLLMSILLFMEDVMAAKSSLLRTKSRFSTFIFSSAAHLAFIAVTPVFSSSL